MTQTRINESLFRQSWIHLLSRSDQMKLTLLHSATTYLEDEPGRSTGSNGDPVAMRAFPPVHFWALSGLTFSTASDPHTGAYVTSCKRVGLLS
jgi:hypothetical protein